MQKLKQYCILAADTKALVFSCYLILHVLCIVLNFLLLLLWFSLAVFYSKCHIYFTLFFFLGGGGEGGFLKHFLLFAISIEHVQVKLFLCWDIYMQDDPVEDWPQSSKLDKSGQPEVVHLYDWTVYWYSNLSSNNYTCANLSWYDLILSPS